MSPDIKHSKNSLKIPVVVQASQKPKDPTSIVVWAKTVSVFDNLPDSAFIRESQLVQSPKRPGNPAPLPFSAPTLWRKVKNRTFPAPVRLSERVTAWNVGDVRSWIAAQSNASI